MQGKYDRNMEDLERGRMEERWGPRYHEQGPFNANFPFQYSQMDPAFFVQQRMFQQPFQQFQNPSLQPFHPGVAQSYYQQTNPFQHPYIQQFQPGFGSYTHPALLPFLQSPFGFNAQSAFNPYTQPYPPTSWQNSYANYPQTEGIWGEYPERKWESFSQRNIGARIPSRAFQRPPRNYRRSDELIRDEICRRLALTPEVDATDVEVIVRDGEVTLRGTVDDRFEKRLVEDIIENTFGVRDLLNEIRIGTPQQDMELTGSHSKSKEK